MKNKKGLTLVELLAVIVILAVILIIAIPRISDAITNSRLASFEASAKTIIVQAEKKYMEQKILENNSTIMCSDIVNINDSDYDLCYLYFDDEGNAKLTLLGYGKFNHIQVINGSKNNVRAEIAKQPEYGNAVDYIRELYVYDRKSNSLKKDTTFHSNIRYVGKKPNNYVSFNNELWRIIGIFDDNIKIVRKDSLTKYSFDNKTTAQGVDSNKGVNDWTIAYIREFLNNYYYDHSTITCHSDSSGKAANTVIECPTINKLNDLSKNLIKKSIWYLGGFKYDISDKSTLNIYQTERGINSDVEIKTSTDYVGLIYPSDYGYASTDTTCENNMIGNAACVNDNWLSVYESYWTISPNSLYSGLSYRVNSNGSFINSDSVLYTNIFPAIYLKNDTKIISGNGTSSDPYILG